MIGKTLFDKQIEVIVKRICRDVNTPDYYDCDCGGMYEAGTRQICQRCGKKICPECKQYHGRETNFCFTKPELRISDDGILTTVVKEGKVYA